MDSTVITGSLNVIDGSTTFKSATLAAVGDGFIAQDIWFQNTAGPQKHQAVALRVGADQAVINRCRIDAYQDTLYAHTNRQFYRDCYITGTVDFIFGHHKIIPGSTLEGYSRAVVLQSYIGDHIDPAGWSVWDGEFALKTLYYGEYVNRGPGAGTSKRVKWPGYRVITSPAEARNFTVAELIQGGTWLESTGVAYTEGL
ncbi:Pectinesterase 2.2 [Vitis vinifera]|uniref:Pectinesterase n=1 Tax=Vitis vinifera TaxID=29760 RepID=A0A438EEK5_VITVI|nr:Pectinesterase 2.2 [Vitis vinifera]